MMILIEGLPGTGKSTLAKNIYQTFSRKGEVSIRLFLETDKDNPFIYKSGTTLDTPINDFSSFVSKAWRTFLVGYNPKAQLAIQESLTIQQQLNFPLVINEVDLGKKLIYEIFNELSKTKVILVYLYSKNPVDHFKLTMKRRGEDWEKQVNETLKKSKWHEINRGKNPADKFIQELSFHTESVLKNVPFEVYKFNIDNTSYEDIQKDISEIIRGMF